MRVGIRFKLVSLLTLVALLPLTAAVLTISAGARELRTESFGLLMQSKASGEAAALSVSLSKDIEKLRLTFQDDGAVAAELSQQTSQPAERPGYPARSRLGERLRRLQQSDNRVAGVLITDRFGHVVSSTGPVERTSLRDEPWWQSTWNGGKGRTVVTPVRYDLANAVYSINICLALQHREQVVGLVQMTLDISRWLADLRPRVGSHEVSVMLVQQDGRIAYWDDVANRGLPMRAPLVSRAEDWTGAIASHGEGGWRVARDRMLQGYSPFRLAGPQADQVDWPAWTLVLYVPASQALGPLYNLSVLTLLAGLGLVGTIFLVGLILVERSFIRRLHRLQHATHRVAQGDLSHRIHGDTTGRRLTGTDEIDELGGDFNRMVAKIQQSHDALKLTSEMKTNFIRIASHELRTPVAYILAVCKMLRDSKDPDRLLHALQTMGGKAKRLEGIIQAMFKIMPDQPYAQEMHYSEFVLSDVLEEIYLACYPFVEERQQHLIIEPGDKNQAIRADRQKVYDMIENLVTNAIKFTPDGGSVRVTVGRQLGQFITITVADQGPGIPEQDLPHIFEPFYSTADVLKHSSGASGFQKRGIGLGLTIVKHFAELHGGSVHVASTPKGSVFTISIPAGPLDEAQPRAAVAPPDQLAIGN